MAKKEIHTHKFKRLRYKSGNEIFFCALPDCSKKLSTALALGKRSICWRCGNEFIMSEYSLRLAKPHCEACHKSKKDIEIPVILGIDYGKEPSFVIEKSLSERLSRTIQQAQQEEEEL